MLVCHFQIDKHRVTINRPHNHENNDATQPASGAEGVGDGEVSITEEQLGCVYVSLEISALRERFLVFRVLVCQELGAFIRFLRGEELVVGGRWICVRFVVLLFCIHLLNCL